MAISRTEARELAKNGMEMGAKVLRGRLTVGPDGILIDNTDVATWLAQQEEGAEFILVAAPIGKSAVENEIKTCYTCGRDYTGEVCPRCARARARLRGWPDNSR